MAQKRSLILVDETNDQPKSEFIKSVETFVKERDKELVNDEGKSLMVISHDEVCGMTANAIRGNGVNLSAAIIDAMMQNDMIAEVISTSVRVYEELKEKQNHGKI